MYLVICILAPKGSSPFCNLFSLWFTGDFAAIKVLENPKSAKKSELSETLIGTRIHLNHIHFAETGGQKDGILLSPL
jgi:hypothetical protein